MTEANESRPHEVQGANGAYDKNIPTTLEKAREWAKEHPVVLTVGSITAGAALAMGLTSGENQEGTTVRTTTEIENPDGTREVFEQETFIPNEQDPKIGGTEEQNQYETHLITDNKEIPEDLKQFQLLAEEQIYEFVFNNSENRMEKDSEEISEQFWRGIILFESEKSGGDTIYGVMKNPLQMKLNDGIYYVAFHETTGQLLVKRVGRWEEHDGAILSDGIHNVTRYSQSGEPFSGQSSLGSPMSFDNEGLRIFDNYEKALRDHEEYYFATVELFSSRDAALNSATFGEELNIFNDEDWEKMHRDAKAIESTGLAETESQ